MSDERARARARLEARMARLEAEEGGGKPSRRPFGSGPRGEKLASVSSRRGEAGASRKAEDGEGGGTADVRRKPQGSSGRGVSPRDASVRRVHASSE